QRQRQLQDDLREAERTRQETESHLGHDRTLLATLAEEMAMLAPEQELSAAAAEEAGIALEQAEQGMQAWQQQWDAFNQQSAEPRRQAEVQQSRIQHLEQSLERLQDRERRLQEERGQLAADPEDAAILELNEQVAIAELALEELQLQEQGQAERLEQLRQELQQLAAEQHQAQGELQRLNGRIASLEALQQAALDPGQGALEWLREQGLEQRPRLAEGLRVEPGWELAVETVLGADLQAVLLDGFDGLALAGFGKGELRLLSPARGAATAAGSLLDKVRADADLSPWLARVKPVETLEQALAQRGALDDGESLISRDGYWVGRHFLRVRRSDEAQGGMLARAQELEALQERREALETRVAEGEERLAAARDEQRELEGAREQVRCQVQEEGRRHGELKAQLSAQQAKVE
ncbi:chromosome segregation protein SMC, partial [Pseudomonas aeruginosa]